MLVNSGTGFGALALAALLSEQSDASGAQASPLAARLTHHRPRAKNVIFLFMEGGPSHIDTFDPKPALQELAGKPLPESFGRVITAMGEFDSPVLASKRKWKQHGESGLWISDWLPHMATRADDLAVIRSCWTNGINHSGGVCQMNTGTQFAGRPSLGSWVTYGLGTENQNLPAFVVMQDKGTVVNGPRNWGTGFMPAVYQGTAMQVEGEPFKNLSPPEHVTRKQQRLALDYLASVNHRHRDSRAENSELEARIRSYELAFQMQSHAPEAVDLAQETAETKALYGLDQKETAEFGRNCLLARRMVERGVRFVQCYHGAGSQWDAHSKIESNHTKMCRGMDKPVAGLLTDLARRGLLEETLVVWGGEFGRTPMSEKGDGRDHNPTGFTMVMAGGGVKAGQTFGSTDEVGLHAVEDRLHVRDLHSTILYLMGIDHKKLVYINKGRPERIDMNEGHVYRKILA
ncbi:DUF1501 domain-containing protein [Roseiconus nitratireducens]|uniref:DUF1501 domain-containing protein n=2 Tax=Roseiconus nitratireducens TaxID=2605748 RepID=A0A5M6CZ86_9BACT|nr:DUF1501 domain-containing protein [Roseiconus nitratireducens]KAA5540548.1 DUF1501 domain-containing protein [Roseiconus nitratireducens]